MRVCCSSYVTVVSGLAFTQALTHTSTLSHSTLLHSTLLQHCTNMAPTLHSHTALKHTEHTHCTLTPYTHSLHLPHSHSSRSNTLHSLHSLSVHSLHSHYHCPCCLITPDIDTNIHHYIHINISCSLERSGHSSVTSFLYSH